MRYGFVTCVRLGKECLEELLSLGGDVVFLGTLEDDKAINKSGRVFLDDLAEKHAIPLTKFGNINDPDALAALRGAELDFLFIIGWSQIARAEALAVPRRGTLGMHPTLLPQGRGRASIPWAILKGLTETGVSLFKLDEGTDTGPLLSQIRVPIEPDETSATLYDKIVLAHRELMRQSFADLESGDPQLREQDESLATEWPGRKPSDGEVYPAQMTSLDLDRAVRALTHPYPGAFVRQGGRLMRIWSGRILAQPSESDGEILVSTLDGHYLVTDYGFDES